MCDLSAEQRCDLKHAPACARGADSSQHPSLLEPRLLFLRLSLHLLLQVPPTLAVSRPLGLSLASTSPSPLARKQIRAMFTETVGDEEFIELWVVYDLETSLRQDVRNPKRKLAWSSQNME